MSKNFFNIKNGTNIGNLAADPSDGRDGDTYYNTATNTVREYVNGGWTDAVQTTTTQTLTNKTINGPSNTITNVAPGSIAPIGADTLIGNFTGSSASPTSLTVTQVNTMLGTLANPMTTLGDTLYEDASPTAARLPGNTTSNREFLTSQGSGGLATAPAWTVLQTTDIPGLKGGTGGEIAYQTAANTTSFIPNGTSGQVLTANGGTSSPTFQTPNLVQIFSDFVPGTSGTYTTPTGATYIRIKIVGGGGGGGSYESGATSAAGGGGGAGAYIEHVIYNPNATYGYTIGAAGSGGVAASTTAGTAGGNTTISSLVAGGGGGGGQGTTGLFFGTPGVAGTPTGGNIISAFGGYGQMGAGGPNGTSNPIGGGGGASYFGSGGYGGSGNSSVSSLPQAGAAPGSGGGAVGASGHPGAAGAGGGIIIEAYYQ